jgi:hypothetical protein
MAKTLSFSAFSHRRRVPTSGRTRRNLFVIARVSRVSDKYGLVTVRPRGPVGRKRPHPHAGRDPSKEIAMKTRHFALALATLFSTNAFAGEDIIGALADQTGLTERQVKMVVGPRSSHAAYLASYDQVQRQFVKSVGQERYKELLARRDAKAQEPAEAEARIASLDAPSVEPGS